MGLFSGSDYRRFEKLVHQYQPRVFGFAFYLLGERETAEDVTQEVLLRLWNHRAELDEARILGWLLRVTRNACIDEHRKRQTFDGLVEVDTDGIERVEGYGLSPEAAAEEADFQARLQAALARLPEPHRSIVVLREVQDMKYEDIGEALGLPLTTVKVYLHRARKMLRERLTPVLERETA